MRALFNEAAVKALEELQNKLKAHNPNIEPSCGLFLNQLLPTLNKWLSPRDTKNLAALLTSTRMKRKNLHDFLRTVADKIDDESLEEVEKTTQHLKTFLSDTPQKQPNLAEKE